MNFNQLQIACGNEFSMILDSEGGVWSFGHPENGTLGHNDDGKFMAKANKVCKFLRDPYFVRANPDLTSEKRFLFKIKMHLFREFKSVYD